MRIPKRKDSPRSSSGSRKTSARRQDAAKLTSRAMLLILLLTICGLGMAALLFNTKQVGAAPQKDGNSPISDQAQLQIKALLDEKESRTLAQRKIDSNLLYAERQARGQAVARGVDTLETTVKFYKENMTTVDIVTNQGYREAETPTKNLGIKLQQMGIEVLSLAGNSIRANIDIREIEKVAALPEVIFISPKQEAKTHSASRLTASLTATQAGSMASRLLATNPGFSERAARVRAQLLASLPALAAAQGKDQPARPNVVNVSEGDKTHKALNARNAFGFNGTGIKIGVLSDGVSNLAAAQATGDLPAVTVLPGQVGSGDEGTAMLELIYDLAPGSQLFFATAFNGITSFAQNIRDLRTAGCDIIVDDVIYFVETPMQDGQAAGVISNTNGGTVIQAVNDVTAAGALYFSSAGNEGNINDGTGSVWEGDFTDGGTLALVPGGTVNDFDPTAAVAQSNQITTSGARALLFWSDPLGGSANDYDLFVLNSAGTAVVASSTNLQTGTQDPQEDAGNRSSGQRMVILKKTGAAARFLHMNMFGAGMQFVTQGNTHGHNHALNAFSVAATPAAAPFCSGFMGGPFPNPFTTANKVECFSSDGPRRILYNANSTPITPGNVSSTGGTLRQKPDITAADGTAVTGVGGFPNPFYGTSAAAPHAAAIAALVKSVNPSFTPAQIRGFLNASALDIEGAGVDRDSGTGIIMAFEALQAAGAVPSAVLAFSSFNLSGQPLVNSCNNLTVAIQNVGAVTANNVTATLMTSTPGVTIQNATQSYGNIAPNQTVSNASPYKLSISNTFVCGATIVINVMTSNGNSFSFNIPTQGPGYVATTMTGQTLVPGTVNVGNSGDDVTTNITLPFTFSYYGTGFTAANVSSNGNLQFTSNSTAFTNVCPLPAAGLNNAIMPHWDDQRTDRAGGGIFTSVSGSAPNRIFNIEWRTVTFSTPESALNYEIRLYETTGQIDFVYANVAGNATNMNGSSASVGVQKADGSGGASNTTQFSCNTASLSAGLKVSFTFNATCAQGSGACATSNPAPTIINEVEPNGTAPTAQVLSGSENCFIVQGAVTPAGDLDFYRLNNVPAGARAWFYTDTGGTLVAGDRDSFIEIFAADGTTIIEADDDDGTGNGGDGTTESGFASSIAGRTLTAGGTYYFRVRGFGTAPGTSVVNPYRMFLVITNTAAVPEVEPNGTAATANTLVTAAQPTGIASGSISSAAEVDFYSVAATAGNILFISMDGDPTRTGVNTLDGVVSLIAPDGTTVLIAADSGFGGANNSEAFDFNISTTGTYFVRVAGFSTESGRAYNLMVSACQGVQSQPCVLTCPANITVSTALNQCSAVVTYPAPTSTGNCGTITCTPPSGSTFQRGTTTVTCTSSGGTAALQTGRSGQLAQLTEDSGFPIGFTGSSVAGLPLSSRLLQIKGDSARPTTSSSEPGRTAAPVAPNRPEAVLFSQLDNPAVGGNVTSQNFEAANDAFDSEVADDFVVPAGVNWTVDQVFAPGTYNPGSGPPASINVIFYANTANLPGAVVATRNAQTFTDAGNLGDFTINLSPTVALAPGTYWVEVQVNMNFVPTGQWFWDNRAAANNQGAAFRNVGNGFGTGCTAFGRKTTCLPTQVGPDQLFQILGTSAPIGGGSTCTFTVTVNDTQPPTIVCPPNVTAVTPVPGAPSAVVTYPNPTVTDNCPMATFACVPPSGSTFNVGTTTVTCTATDMSGNTATCSFTVTLFNICIQDDSNPNNVLLFITSGPETGSYRFCCGGAAPRTGIGTVKQIGSSYTLSHQPPNRRVQATFNIDTTSTASLQEPAGTIICTLTDRPTVGVKTCICAAGGGGGGSAEVTTPQK